MITQERLKELFIYEPETGVFTRKYKKRTHNKKESHGWIQKGYWAIKIDGVKYLCHRLAFLYMTGSMPVDCVDHINRNRGDNRWENLRDCTHAENRKNNPINKRNTTGASGVSFRKERKFCVGLRTPENL